MKLKSKLLGSASAIATSAVAMGAAHAAGPVASPASGAWPDGYTFSVEGGFAVSPNTQSIDKFGASGGPPGVIKLDHDLGYYGAISIGKQVNNLWDVAVGASVTRLMQNTGTFSGGFSGGPGFRTGTLKSDFGFETADLEFGYHPPELNQDMDVRLFAGVRALHSLETNDKTGTAFAVGGDSGGFEHSSRDEFLGAGPRIGIDFSKKFDDTSFGISGMVAGAAIFGLDRHSETVTVHESGGGPPLSATFPNSSSEMKTILNLQGALGVDYYTGDTSKLTVGVQGQGLWNVRSGFAGSSTDYLEYGPFAKWVTNF